MTEKEMLETRVALLEVNVWNLNQVLASQGRLLGQIIQERDEARANLRTASAQWAQWRKTKK